MSRKRRTKKQIGVNSLLRNIARLKYGQRAYSVLRSNTPAGEAYAAMQKRLIDDVQPAMEIYRRTFTGNWASIRMIAPVIEAAAGSNRRKLRRILQEMGIEYPEIFWTMYRHAFAHNDDMPQSVSMGNIGIGWGMNWEQEDVAVVVGTVYSINPSKLFDNFLSWLETHKYDPGMVASAVLVSIDSSKKSLLKSELMAAQSGIKKQRH